MKRCKGCDSHLGITWAELKTQYKRLINDGYTQEQIKEALPRCQKCITVWKQEHQKIDFN